MQTVLSEILKSKRDAAKKVMDNDEQLVILLAKSRDEILLKYQEALVNYSISQKRFLQAEVQLIEELKK
jgi:hypothetical protein